MSTRRLSAAIATGLTLAALPIALAAPHADAATTYAPVRTRQGYLTIRTYANNGTVELNGTWKTASHWHAFADGTIRNGGGLCLSDTNGSTTSTLTVVTCNGTHPNQVWQVTPGTTGSAQPDTYAKVSQRGFRWTWAAGSTDYSNAPGTGTIGLDNQNITRNGKVFVPYGPSNSTFQFPDTTAGAEYCPGHGASHYVYDDTATTIAGDPVLTCAERQVDEAVSQWHSNSIRFQIEQDLGAPAGAAEIPRMATDIITAVKYAESKRLAVILNPNDEPRNPAFGQPQSSWVEPTSYQSTEQSWDAAENGQPSVTGATWTSSTSWTPPGGSTTAWSAASQAAAMAAAGDTYSTSWFYSQLAVADPGLGSDREVILDVFNEPGNINWPGNATSYAQWLPAMQAMVTWLRSAGWGNQLWVEPPGTNGFGAGYLYSNWAANQVSDPRHDMVYDFHHTANGPEVPRVSTWNSDFGDIIEKHLAPVVDGEWTNRSNASSTNAQGWGTGECWPAAPTAVPAYLSYARALGLGLSIWQPGGGIMDTSSGLLNSYPASGYSCEAAYGQYGASADLVSFFSGQGA